MKNFFILLLLISFSIQDCSSLILNSVEAKKNKYFYRSKLFSHDFNYLSLRDTSRQKGGILTSIFMTTNADDESLTSQSTSKVKLPIIQIFERGEILGEFICGNDVDAALLKLKACLASIVSSKSNNNHDENYSKGSINNIYSDSQIENECKSESTIIVINLYRDGCKKCGKVEPVFYSLSQEKAFSPPLFRFLQAEVGNIPNYTLALKERLTGILPSQPMSLRNEVIREEEKKEIDCKSCQNTGFLPCNECKGLGIVTRGENSVYCPTCVGYKKIRCSECGGLCITCSG